MAICHVKSCKFHNLVSRLEMHDAGLTIITCN
jgi:hypothetical protein